MTVNNINPLTRVGVVKKKKMILAIQKG